MYCDKCGIENPDGIEVCQNCGNVLGIVENSDKYSKKKNDKGIKTAVILILAVVALVVIFLLVNIFTGGADKAIKKSADIVNDVNIENVIKMYPKVIEKLAKEDEKVKASIIDYIRENRIIYEDLYGEDVKLTYKIVDRTKYTQEELESKEEELEGNLKKYFREQKDINLQSAYEYAVKVTAEGNKRNAEFFITRPIYKIDGRWCTEIYIN